MGNIQKTICYFKRNGFKNTYYAVAERLFCKDVPFNTQKYEPYDGPLDENIKFSILVPVYETHETHLREMIDSVLNQVYTNFELVLADASKSDNPHNIIKEYLDPRIKYVRVIENKSISDNTNVAVDAATGDYCGLLDHDDLLTPDALYEMAVAIMKSRLKGVIPKMIYSDEDKCDGNGRNFFGRHVKEKLNLDLLMSNNYICHFTCIESSLIKKLKFRPEYNGSQDYDIILRTVAESNPEEVLYIGKVLYHWRCHEESTAFNPASKEYAYDAGRRAIEDFVKNKYGKELQVTELCHKGFYKVEWGKELFALRPDVGAKGSCIVRGNKITSGIIDSQGVEKFNRMNKHYSGYMHRKDLYSDVYALDIRSITPCPNLIEEYLVLLKEYEDYVKKYLPNNKEKDEYAKALGLKFGDILHEKGLLLLYTPEMKEIK